MKEIFTLKPNCGHESYYDYELNPQKIIAITGGWHNETSKNEIGQELLAEIPIVGEKYKISIFGGLKIDVSHNFWVIYFDPYFSFYSDEGIESMRFCLCSKTKILEIGEKKAILEVEILEVTKLIPCETKEFDKETKTLPQSIMYCNIENFKNYSVLQIDIQGDLGWNYIIKKKDKKSTIIAKNYWDFHQDMWFQCNEDITEEQEITLGITH